MDSTTSKSNFHTTATIKTQLNSSHLSVEITDKGDIDDVIFFFKSNIAVFF